MKIIKRIFLFLILLISNNSICCDGFKTGEEYWKSNKLHYHLTVAGQFRQRHSPYSEMDLFDHMIELDKRNELYCPIVYRLDIVEVNTLSIALNPRGSAQLQLFLAFNEAIVEILDTLGEIYNKSHYLRSDLKTIQDYTTEVLIFLKSVEHTSRYIFKGEKNNFNKQKFLTLLENPYATRYTEASVFNGQIELWEKNIKKNHGGVMSAEQYIDHYIDVYLKLFTNQYVFIKAHLMSNDKTTRLQLNRNLEGELKDFVFNLTAINALNLLNPKTSEKKTKNHTTSKKKSNVTNNQFKNSPNRKGANKRNKNNKTEIVPSIKSTVSSFTEPQDLKLISETKQTNQKLESLSNSVSSILPSSTEQPSETKETSDIEEEKKDQPVEGIVISSLEKSNDDADLLNDIILDVIPFTEQIETDLLNDINLDVVPFTEQIVSKEKNKLAQEKENTQLPTSQFQESASKLKELNRVLDEFDGGPSAGMKTRKFLKLCEAINKLGYFSDFSANEKEVKIKTNDIVTVMHTNHSGNKKNPGISNNTANKLKEVIEGIQTNDETGDSKSHSRRELGGQ